MRALTDKALRLRVQEEAARRIRLEGIAFELNDWLKERGVQLRSDEGLRLADTKTYVELDDLRLSEMRSDEYRPQQALPYVAAPGHRDREGQR